MSRKARFALWGSALTVAWISLRLGEHSGVLVDVVGAIGLLLLVTAVV